MTDIEKHFYDTMIQRIKDTQEERAKKEIHPNIIVMGEDHFHSLERQQITKCGHDAQWGSLSERSVHASVGGVKVFSSPHLPPDTMLVIDDSAMKDVWPALSMQLPNDPWHYMVTPPQPMPDFGPLLHAAHGGMFACAPRPRINVFDLDEPPAKETRQFVKFYSDRITLHAKLRSIFETTLLVELHRRGKTWPHQARLPQPPFKSASQTRAAAQKAKAKARRKALRFRKRSKRALQRA